MSNQPDNSEKLQDKGWQALTLPTAWVRFLRKIHFAWEYINFGKETKKSGSTVEGFVHISLVKQHKTN